MKLRYRGMSRHSEWGGYPAARRGFPDKARHPGIGIHVAGVTRIGCVGAGAVTAKAGDARALLAHAGIHEPPGRVPILNSIVTISNFGRAAFKTNQIAGGRFVTKKRAYAPPRRSQIETFRNHYGDAICPKAKAP